MCLMSGKVATDACTHDIRLVKPLQPYDFIVTSPAYVYKEDVPTEVCDKHVMVDYCSRGGVATEWCKKFAEVDPSFSFSQRGLVKMTKSETDEILKVEKYQLLSDYLRDDYIYLVDKNGHDASYHGISGKINQGLNVPYEVCRIHTKQSWEDYQRPPATTTPTKPPTSSTEPIPPTTGETNPTTLPTEPTVEETTPPTETMPPTESTPATRPTEPEQTTDIETER
jgi:hypothetical protein